MSDSERLAVVEEAVLRIEHRLFGNGQPGELSEVERRITKLEKAYLIAIGIMLTVSTLVQMAILVWTR